MIDIFKENCCGCRVCELVCPVDAIKMEYNNEGFLYPHVDKVKCIKCGKCRKFCTVNEKQKGNHVEEVYAAWAKNNEEIKESSSGGIAYALAKEIIKRHGCVYGAVYGQDMLPYLEKADKLDEAKRMRGSKYVQCDTKDIFLSVKEEAEQGRTILFVGTPCQIGALKKYLQKDYDNLYMVDILCGGVSSPLLFQAYCERLSKKIGGKVSNYDFRNKDKHGWSWNAKIGYKKEGKERKKYIPGAFDKYIIAYLQKTICRENCYRCGFTSTERLGDITIGDFWGLDKWQENLNVDRGVSFMLINDPKGKELFHMIIDSIEFIPERLEHLLITHKALSEPCKRPSHRKEVMEEFVTSTGEGYKAKRLGKSYTIVDILTRIYLFVQPKIQRRLQRTFLYRIYRKIVK